MGNVFAKNLEKISTYSNADIAKIVEKHGFDAEFNFTNPLNGFIMKQSILDYIMENKKEITCLYLFKNVSSASEYIETSLTSENNVFMYAIFSHCYSVVDYLIDNYRNLIVANYHKVDNIISRFSVTDNVDYVGNVLMTDHVITRLIEDPHARHIILGTNTKTYVNLVRMRDLEYFTAIMQILIKHNLHDYLTYNDVFVKDLDYYGQTSVYRTETNAIIRDSDYYACMVMKKAIFQNLIDNIEKPPSYSCEKDPYLPPYERYETFNVMTV